MKVSFTAGSPDKLVDMETLRDWECFDADSGKDLATELREYFIPDFSHWKEHDPFGAAFARLLKDLRAEGAGEVSRSAQSRLTPPRSAVRCGRRRGRG